MRPVKRDDGNQPFLPFINLKRTPLAAVATAALFVLTAFPIAAQAQQSNWSAWQPCGNSVSVSFSQVAGTSTWTWKFRNDGTQAITYMDFYYTDNTGQNTDVLPGSLNPGDVIGGWAAFTANSRPTIQIKSIQWANSPAAGAGGQSSQPQNNGAPPQAQAQPGAGQGAPQQAGPQQALQQRQLAAVNQLLAKAQASQAAGQNMAAALQDAAAMIADTDGDAAADFRADLAPYGKWMDLNGQAYWQPGEAGLGSKWRPYADGGHWVLTDAGWTWDSQYDWGWAAFHYGRWVDDPVLGWLWAPGRQWGPAWVAWRGNDTLCGWAPLPPGSGYQVGFGFWFHGALVSVDFDFGLGPDDYFFIGISDMCQPGYLACQVPAARAAQVYKQTAMVKTAYMAHGGKVINAGIAADRVRALTHRDIKPLKIADAQSSREKGARGNTLAVYRPRIASGGATRPAEKPAQAARAGAVMDDLLAPANTRHEAAQKSPGRASQVMDDLLAPAPTTRKPAPARAARAGDVMDDLLAPANTRHEAAQKSPGRAGGVMDELLSGGPGARKPVQETAQGSEDVMDKLLARGHDMPAPRIGPASRPSEPAGNGSRTAASQTGYTQPAGTYQPQQPARQPVPAQPYQAAQPARQPVSGQAYQPPQTAYQPAQQAGQAQGQWQEQQAQQQREAEQERQQQLAQQRQEAQERQQQLAQERQQQMEEQRQQREEEQRQQREAAQERERERQQRMEEQRQRQLEEQQERERERQRQLEEQREREREKKKPY